MLQFNVPQFIDVEDRIIGVLTIKQFAFIGAGGLLDVALFKLAYPGIAFWFGALVVSTVFAFIAFYQFNGRPMYASFSIVQGYLMADKLYVFKQDNQHVDASILRQHLDAKAAPPPASAESTGSQLAQIAALLDQKSAEESDTFKGTSIQ